jgi:hypothetical protein
MLESAAPLANGKLTRTRLARIDSADVQGPGSQSASSKTRRPPFHSRPTFLVVHSRCHAVRFRILSTHAPTITDVPVSLSPVSFLQGHRMCQKAKDCDGVETSDRYQR